MPPEDDRGARDHSQVESESERDASIRALESGQLPVEAERRLAEEASGAGPFTSDLSSQEAALVRRAGYEPLGLVVGSCFYHVGFLYATYGDGELQGLSRAYNAALELAVGRLEKEAAALRAHGVVGVRVTMRRREWAEHMIEVVVVGTAVRGAGPAAKRPFTSDLSGQEFWALHEAGYEPRSIVYGNCVWVVYHTINDEYAARSWSNVEMQHFSQSVYRSRNVAMDVLRHQAAKLQAGGVVGVRFDRRIGEVRIQGNDAVHNVIYLTVLGTAIGTRQGAAAVPMRTLPMIDLRSTSKTAPEPADVSLE